MKDVEAGNSTVQNARDKIKNVKGAKALSEAGKCSCARLRIDRIGKKLVFCLKLKIRLRLLDDALHVISSR